VVVVEWAWERFDEATARWCFARLGPLDPASEPACLHRRREDLAATGQPWDTCCWAWATQEALHIGQAIMPALDSRFDRRRKDPAERHPVRRQGALRTVPPARRLRKWTALRRARPVSHKYQPLAG
jgi:hypothetical protein